MFIVNHTETTKHVVLSLFKKGLSATEVARESNKQLRGQLNRLLTKNSVLGIKNRAGKCIPRDPRNYPKERKKITYPAYDKSVAFNEKIERVPYEQTVKARLIAALR
jgi:hypothetical protein